MGRGGEGRAEIRKGAGRQTGAGLKKAGKGEGKTDIRKGAGRGKIEEKGREGRRERRESKKWVGRVMLEGEGRRVGKKY